MSDQGNLRINENAHHVCDAIIEAADDLRVKIWQSDCGAVLIDCGVEAPGGLTAGRLMAEVCLGDLGEVEITPGDRHVWSGPAVTVVTD